MECPKCGAPFDGKVCSYCGYICEEEKTNVTIINNIYGDNNSSYPAPQNQNFNYVPPQSPCSRSIAILLAALGFIGLGGLHRFYTGKILTGIFYFLTFGVFFIGTILDIIDLARGKFKDSNNLVVGKIKNQTETTVGFNPQYNANYVYPPIKKTNPLVIVIISIIIFVFVVIPLIGHNARSSPKGNNIPHSQTDTSVQIDTAAEQTNTSVEDYKITYQNSVIYKNTLGKIVCSCIVEIENVGNDDLYLDDAVFDFEDKDGNLLAMYSTLISSDPERVSKGEKGYFYCNSAPVAGNIDENAEYIFSPKLKVEKSKYDIIKYDISETSISEGRHTSEYTVIGRINNSTSEDDSMVWLCCVLYRDDGTPIAASGINILDLKAGETRSFDIQGIKLSEWNIETSDIADYKVYAFKSQYQ